MNDDLKKNLLNIEAFQRFALMLLFVLAFTIVELVIYAIAIFQVLHLLFSGTVHQELKAFAQSLSIYVFDITKFLTFASETMPFPFQPWPKSKIDKESKTVKNEELDDNLNEDEIHA